MMDNYLKLPTELWIECLRHLLNQVMLADADLSAFLKLRRISRGINSLIESDACWLPCVGQAFLQEAKHHQLPYRTAFTQCYTLLQAIVNSSDALEQKLIALEKEGVKNLSVAHVMMRYSTTRKLFLTDSKDNSIAYEQGLSCMTQIGIQHESIAFFILQDLTVKQAFLAYEDGLGLIIDLAKAHAPVARFIFFEDKTLCDALLNTPSANGGILRIFSEHEAVFLEFFKNKKLKERFLEITATSRIDIKRRMYFIAFIHKVLYVESRDIEKSQCIADLIDHILDRLEKRQLILKAASEGNMSSVQSRLNTLLLEKHEGDLDSHFFYITNIGIQCESIAFCILKDSLFRQALLKHKERLTYLIDLAKTHVSVACFIFKEDSELCDAMLSDPESIRSLLDVFTEHEAAFITFFKNIALKERFLRRCALEAFDVSDAFYNLGLVYKIFFIEPIQGIYAPESFIEHIIDRLERRYLILKEEAEGNARSVHSELSALLLENNRFPSDHNLFYITDMGVLHESIALFIVQDPIARKAFLEEEEDLGYIAWLAKAHQSVALFIFETNLEAPELYHAIVNNLKVFSENSFHALSSLLAIFYDHEEAFLAFFKNIEFKTLFLKATMMFEIHMNQQIGHLGVKYQVFCEAQEYTWYYQTPQALIENIIETLLERRRVQPLEAQHLEERGGSYTPLVAF